MLDIAALRADTPGCATVLHLNNAGAALMPRPVYGAVTAHLAREYATGGYEAREEAAERLEAVYRGVAALVGGKPGEVAIVENATRAFDMGFHAIPFAPGDVIFTAVAEYASNYLAYLRVVEATGGRVEVRVVPDDERGQLDVAALERMLADPGRGKRARLVALAHVPTQSGLVQPAAAIGAAARAHGALFLLDATQSAGQLPLDVAALGCDLLCSTGRKYLRGPRGVGFLWVREAILPELRPPFVDLHAATWTGPGGYSLRPDARRFENWESNIAGTLGLGAAIDYALALGLDAIAERVTALAARLRAGLAAIPGLTVRDRGATLCGIVTFSLAGRDPEGLRLALRDRRDRPDGTAGARPINVSTSTASSALLDFAGRDVTSWTRASVHYYNTEAELDEFLGAVEALARVPAGHA
ncbi:MAG: aminotransferase class V-fold PLP-dependent enzyme [Chloroflexota bacterium]|nr:aminotransferase class V-fold PLP-dependent enzyme [Chloroflexota bacterium]